MLNPLFILLVRFELVWRRFEELKKFIFISCKSSKVILFLFGKLTTIKCAIWQFEQIFKGLLNPIYHNKNLKKVTAVAI